MQMHLLSQHNLQIEVQIEMHNQIALIADLDLLSQYNLQSRAIEGHFAYHILFLTHTTP